MKHNRLRALLNDNRPTLGTRIESTWPLMTEIVGSTGLYDYIEFVAEYAPYIQSDLENIARAAELHGLSSMIKVDYQNRAYACQKAMASGFQAVLLTDHRTADEVRESIRMIRPDTPEDNGRFGYPNRRWIGYTPRLKQMDYAAMVRSTVVAVMIEKAEALENIEAICSVEGVDMVQFGPSDYSMSRGWNLIEHKEEVRAAERAMIETALRLGVHPRCEINTAEEANYYQALGVRHFCLGDEIKNATMVWQREGEALRAKLP